MFRNGCHQVREGRRGEARWSASLTASARMPVRSPDGFDVKMLSCHTASCANLLLFFSKCISWEYGLIFEMALLAVKAAMEISLGVLTPDLRVHHLGMGIAAATATQFPERASCALFVNVIHLPLAVNYARRLSGARRGGALDVYFGCAWLLVVAARVGMLAAQAVQTYRLDLPVRWVFYISCAVIAALDLQWSRETFAKRELPHAWPLILGAGALLGSMFESREAMAVWGCASAASLLIVVSAMLRTPASPAPGLGTASATETTD